MERLERCLWLHSGSGDLLVGHRQNHLVVSQEPWNPRGVEAGEAGLPDDLEASLLNRLAKFGQLLLIDPRRPPAAEFRGDRQLGWDLPDLDPWVRRGVQFRSLQEQLDTATSGGKLIFHVFGALAEFERDLIRERTMAALAAAEFGADEGVGRVH